MKQAPVLTDAQVKKLLKMTQRLVIQREIVWSSFFSYYVGLRACEIASLKVGDVLDGEGNIKDTVLLTKT